MTLEHSQIPLVHVQHFSMLHSLIVHAPVHSQVLRMVLRAPATTAARMRVQLNLVERWLADDQTAPTVRIVVSENLKRSVHLSKRTSKRSIREHLASRPAHNLFHESVVQDTSLEAVANSKP